MEMKKLCKGVNFAYHRTNQFKTATITFSFVAPLDDKASENALIIHLLARTCAKHKTVLEMNRKLASLYGAVLSPSVTKDGESVLLSLSLNIIDDRFTLSGESVCREAVELLCSCIFRPDVTPDGFNEENLKREKMLLIQKIESENDDKRMFALKRMIEEMCEKEAYSINKLGYIEKIESLTGKELLSRWTRLIVNCPVHISYVGSADEKIIEETVMPYFEQIGRKEVWPIKTDFITDAYEQKTITEAQNVKQGKLVIGYRAGMAYDRDNFAAIKLMTMIFGGGTFSKLFANVREKMSLCYYCNARLVANKGIIVVESGVETENAQKALEAIRNELEEVKKGNFTKENLASAKLSFCDALRSVKDSADQLISWMLSYTTASSFVTPEQMIEMINAVSKEEIIVAANMISEDTVYILEAEKEAE